MKTNCTYTKFLATGIALISVLNGVYAQKAGLPENKKNIIDYRYQKFDYSLPRFPKGYPLRDRFYIFSDAGIEANWEASKEAGDIFFNPMVHAGLGFKITPVHAIEGGFLFASAKNALAPTDAYARKQNSYGGQLNYVMNLTAFGYRNAELHKFEAYGIAGLEYRSDNKQAVGVHAGMRFMYNPIPLIGLYAQSGMSVNRVIGSGKDFRSLPYVNAGLIFRFGKPQIYIGDYLPPFALKTNLLFDLATALNFEIEFPIQNRFSLAAEWVFPWWTIDNYKENSKRTRLQILNGNIEARYWFGNREKKRLLNGWFAGIYGGGGLYDIEWKGKGVQGEFFIAAGLSGGYSHRIAEHLSMEYAIGVGILSTDYRTYRAHFCEDAVWYPIREKRGRYTWIGPTRAKVSLVWMINEKDKKGGKR